MNAFSKRCTTGNRHSAVSPYQNEDDFIISSYENIFTLRLLRCSNKEISINGTVFKSSNALITEIAPEIF